MTPTDEIERVAQPGLLSADDDAPIIWACQGPPRCQLEGDAAVKAQMDGCMWCKKIICHADGTETVTQPSSDEIPEFHYPLSEAES